MANITNNNRFTTVSTLTDSSPDQIKDGADFPHTGLIKALSLGMKGNYAISGFNITSTTDTSLTVASGVIFRDGLKESANGATLTLSTTYTNGYHLVVVPAGSAPQTVVLRNPSAQDKVAEYTDGDVIIAVATYTGNDPMQIQFLTANKTANGLTVGFDSSGYNEVGKVYATASTEMQVQTIANNANIKLNPHGSGVVELAGELDVNGNEIKTSETNGSITIAPNTGGEIILGNSDSTELTVTSRGIRDLRLATNSGTNSGEIVLKAGSNDNIEITPHGTGDVLLEGNVGIQTTNAQKHLHIRGSDPAIRLQEDSENGYLELSGKSENQGQIRLTNLNTAANESATLDLEAYSSGDNAQTIRMFRLANTPTNAVTSFQILKPNTTNFAFKVIADSGNTTIASGAYLQAPRLNTATLNSDTTLSESSHAGLYLFVTGSSRTITLPNTHGAGVHFTLLSNDANGFTLTSTDNMNGASDDISVSARDGVTCISDGTDWVVLGA